MIPSKIEWIKYKDMDIKMTSCPLCSSALPSDHPALLLAELDKTVKDMGGWDSFKSDDTRWGKAVGSTFRVGVNTAKVEAKKLDAGYPKNGYDGAYEQGTEFETYIVIEINGIYFKKSGHGDSYGEISWDGDLKIAKVSEKLIKVFE